MKKIPNIPMETLKSIQILSYGEHKLSQKLQKTSTPPDE